MIDKARVTEILKILWANRENPIHGLFVEMLEFKLQQGKDMLVTDCTPDNFPIVQGQAKAYYELLSLLKRQPVELPKG